MEYLSIKDMFKIGVGPSSSHTLGPWLAALEWSQQIDPESNFLRLYVRLFGSLSLTGIGHATDKAIILGLSGYKPDEILPEQIDHCLDYVINSKSIPLPSGASIPFDPETDIVFEREFLDFHANGMSFHIINVQGQETSQIYYSVGGGFICRGGESNLTVQDYHHPYPIDKAKDLENYCAKEGMSIYEIVMANELTYMSQLEFESYLLKIWDVMLDSIYRGCHKDGLLPGGLDVMRRASKVYRKLYPHTDYMDKYSWLEKLKIREFNVSSIFKWVSCFALAVNEENASLGRVVTAPTNGTIVLPGIKK